MSRVLDVSILYSNSLAHSERLVIQKDYKKIYIYNLYNYKYKITLLRYVLKIPPGGDKQTKAGFISRGTIRIYVYIIDFLQ